MKTIETLARRLGRDLTSKGNLELGSYSAGSDGTPGSAARRASITYYLLSNGEYRAMVDNRSGHNQGGHIDWQGGDLVSFDAVELEEVICLAGEHSASLNNDDLTRALRIASNHARRSLREMKLGK